MKSFKNSDISNLGWKHDPNESGEEQPSLFKDHGYSEAFCIDLQDTDSNTAYLLYVFPDDFLIIDSIVNCGSGRETMLFRGYVKTLGELETLMRQVIK